MEEKPEEQTESFKKPLFTPKIGTLPKKSKPVEEPQNIAENKPDNSDTAKKSTPDATPLNYDEPPWSSVPDAACGYKFEVLKNGSIIETIPLERKSCWVFGRLPACDVSMQHPTISRYHAVLLYRAEPKENAGFYIYDLGSTHGTFLNKNRLVSKVYAPVRVGHMLKLGCSTRAFILQGPEEDSEMESELSVTELKQQRLEEIRQRNEEVQRLADRRKKQEEAGIDWGMGEDAEEETDLSVNPFAETNNEDLYLSDPKKALRGFFEREGLDLEYDCTEQGIGQFLCKVELPIDDEMGRPICAEVLQKSKKKEAVIQCALEACRILDRHGLLRQATHESRKRKAKNWEENDYYDSDDDTFLDRTGSIEKKRDNRMKHKHVEKVETYESLTEKEKELAKEITDLEVMIEEAHALKQNEKTEENEADSLDSFMSQLNEKKPDKQSVNKLKNRLKQLKQDRENMVRLINIVKPASMPPLVITDSKTSKNKMLPMFGKRKKTKLQLPSKSTETSNANPHPEDEEEIEEAEGSKDKEETGERSTQIITRKIEEAPEEPLEHNQKEIVQENKKTGKSVEKVEKDRAESSKARRKEETKSTMKTKKKTTQVDHELKAKYGDDMKSADDYEMWVPPSDQSGDGRTSLNEKLGY